jgi:hypothetical protein
MSIRTVRSLAVLPALGGILWGVAWIVSPSDEGSNSQVEIWASGVFQLGLLGMLAVMWFSHATGPGRSSRVVLASEVVALLLAMAWTAPYLFDANRATTGALVVLDLFWPLSMVGLIIVGVMVARAGRWPSPVRYLPLVASLLIPVDIAVSWAPDDVRNAVMGVYLAAAYGSVGVAMFHTAPKLAGRDSPDESAVQAGGNDGRRRVAPALGPE